MRGYVPTPMCTHNNYRCIGLFGCKSPAPNVYFKHRFAEAMVSHQLITITGHSRLPSIHRFLKYQPTPVGTVHLCSVMISLLFTCARTYSLISDWNTDCRPSENTWITWL